MKKMMSYCSVAALTVLLSSTVLAESSSMTKSTFDDPLVLIEVVSVEPFDSSNDDRFVVKSKERVHQAIGKVIDVFDGPLNLVGKTFPLASPLYTEGTREPESLTPNVLEFEGISDKQLLPVGSRMVLPVMRIEDYNYAKYNHFGFPDRSVFFLLFGTGFQLDKVMPDRFDRRLDWAKAIKRFNGIEEDEDRVTFLKKSIRNENPLLSVSAVHLLKRYFPQLAEEYFDEIILASGTPFHARLAIDHEFCLSRGQAWVSDKQKELEPILEREAAEALKGTRLMSFRKQMIDNGSWFGGRGERE